MTERLVALALTPAWLACTAGWAGVVALHAITNPRRFFQ